MIIGRGEEEKCEKAAKVKVSYMQGWTDNPKVPEKVKEEIEATKALNGKKIRVQMRNERGSQARMTVRVDNQLIIYSQNINETPVIYNGWVSYRTYMLPYESEENFAKRVCADIVYVMNWLNAECSVNIWKSDKGTASKTEKELWTFLEKNLYGMSGYSVKADFSILEDEATTVSCLILFQIFDRVGGELLDDILCCYSDDKEWMYNVRANSKTSDNLTYINYCENMDDIKAAIKKNIKEIKKRLLIIRGANQIMSMNRIKEVALQEYVDKKIRKDAFGVNIFADIDVSAGYAEGEGERVYIEYGACFDKSFRENVIICKNMLDANQMQTNNDDAHTKIYFAPTDEAVLNTVNKILDRACHYMPQLDTQEWRANIINPESHPPYENESDSQDDIDFTFWIDRTE